MTRNLTDNDREGLHDPLIVRWGREMMEACPEETAGLTLSQCIEAWLDYSDRMCAGWMDEHTDTETVGQVMSQYRHKE